MKLVYLYAKRTILTGLRPRGYRVCETSVNIPIELHGEKPMGYIEKYPLYTMDQLSKHLDVIQGYKSEVVLKVVGEIG